MWCVLQDPTLDELSAEAEEERQDLARAEEATTNLKREAEGTAAAATTETEGKKE